MIYIKRIYEPAELRDGFRILVDRLWPRGMTKEKARIDLWLRDIAPSDSLRKWFNHQLENWDEFKQRYFKELATKNDMIEIIQKRSEQETVTLLYSAKSETLNNAVALKEFIERKINP
ncbi:MAG: DUF488 domain-containing protein [Candidatus Atribacteria bacterium]|nr:DUF488 domain-containing protein [Candidatus Atribacteria bacterium]